MPGAGSADDYLSVEIHQATGMVAAQASCDMIEAFARLQIRATAMGQSLHDTALDVIDRIIRFDD